MKPYEYATPRPVSRPLPPGSKIAVIGSGAAGLAAAWSLSQVHDVTLYEASSRVGGHCHTHYIDGPDGADHPIPVDTGFIVFNDLNYPMLTAAFDHLGVETQESCMSFSVSVAGGGLEYSGNGVGGLFAQKRNIARPSHWLMIRDLVRFYKEAPGLLEREDLGEVTLGALLDAGRYGQSFRHYHLYPMAAAIWSMPVGEIESFPAASFLQFFHNHGLFRFKDRPQWRTVTGGSQAYVARLLDDYRGAVRAGHPVRAVEKSGAGVRVKTDAEEGAVFDAVVIASHGDQALKMLAAPSPLQRTILGAFGYEPNKVYLHQDESLMPRRKSVWASWNYMSNGKRDDGKISVTYWMNRLQGLDERVPLFVSLNPLRAPDPAKVIKEIDYDHPSYDAAAFAAQKELGLIQGEDNIWFCGSYHGYGFHEDAFGSGLKVAQHLGAELPWAPKKSGVLLSGKELEFDAQDAA
ncbi:MAG: FAD-dependent oxidoreductase [Alphaproteobacteria bacterium]|nr:FAD-dependent oxidoreductase [Alphaproteobacteria bacterium]